MASADFTLSELIPGSLISRWMRIPISSRRSRRARLRPEFRTQLDRTVPLALSAPTEKAWSRSIIAPILAELWLQTGQQIGLFSGVDFPVDPQKA